MTGRAALGLVLHTQKAPPVVWPSDLTKDSWREERLEGSGRGDASVASRRTVWVPSHVIPGQVAQFWPQNLLLNFSRLYRCGLERRCPKGPTM